MSNVKAFSYVRFSSPEQAKGNSLERQTKAAREYATANGLDLDETLTFFDPGLSAFEGRNFREGDLAAFVAACDTGRVPSGSFLLVENLDRLSRRKPLEAVTQLQSILKRQVTVVTLSDRKVYGPNSMDDFASLMMAVVTMQRAHEESALKSMRLGKAWEAKRRRAVEDGKPMTSMTPGWLVLRGGRIEINEDRVEVVREIFRLGIAGNGNRRIAKVLTMSGVLAFGRAIGWHSSAVQKILENEAVLGTFQPHRMVRKATGARERVPVGEPIRGYFPAIIDEATFLRARVVRTERRIPSGRKGERLSNLFTGVATCALCGGPMHFDNKGEGYTSLTCGNAKRGAVSHAPNRWRYPIVERFGLLALYSSLDLEGILPNTEADPLNASLKEIGGKLLAARETAARADKAAKAMLDLLEQDGLPEYRDRMMLRSREKAEAEAEAARLEATADALRVRVVERENDRATTDDTLRHWAMISEGTDADAAYSARVQLQQLLRRSVSHMELRRGHDGDPTYGDIYVILKSGYCVSMWIDDNGPEAGMRAHFGRAHFVPDDEWKQRTAEDGPVHIEEVELPEWWPHR